MSQGFLDFVKATLRQREGKEGLRLEAASHVKQVQLLHNCLKKKKFYSKKDFEIKFAIL